MSIYGGRKHWKNFGDLDHRVPAGAPPADIDDAPVDRGADWASMRKARPADFILPATRAWLDALPADVVPASLVERYPRIVNMIAMHWSDRLQCARLFDELLGDRRAGRAGFPPASQRDLLDLQEFWYNGHAAR